MKIPTPNPSVHGIKNTALKSTRTHQFIQDETRAMIDLWMYNYARNIPDITSKDNKNFLTIPPYVHLYYDINFIIY